jgi:hypothetical protein
MIRKKASTVLPKKRWLMKKIIIFFCFLVGIVSVANAEETRVDAGLTAFEFNSVGSTYMPRPTFATIQNSKGASKTYIRFDVKGYGNSGANFEVAPEFVDENVDAINKYLNWAKMARERGDMLDKEIAVVRGIDTGPFYVWNRYTFHSGNAKSHYLVIDIGTKIFSMFSKNDQMSKGSVIFDEENAARLIKRLQEFKENKIPQTKTEDYK